MTSIQSEVDTRRPFRSVKEAVAIFGERIISGEAYSQITSSAIMPEPPPPPPPPKKPQYSPPSPSYSTSSSRFNQDRDEEYLNVILSSMKRLEAELNETKSEVTQLKQRGSETEIAVATLNAELHKSKAKLAEMEAASGVFMEEQKNLKVGSDRWGVKEENEEIMEVKYEYLPSFAASVRLGEADGDEVNGRRVKKMKKKKKKKPIVPLIGDLFSRKKDSGEMGDSLYCKSYFNVA